MLIYTNKNIIFTEIRDNCDYIINNKINFSDYFSEVFDFNSNLDLLCIYYQVKFDIYFKEYTDLTIQLFSFPDYSEAKSSLYNKIKGIQNEKEEVNENNKTDKLQFINNNIFFHFSKTLLELYTIKKNECSLVKKVDINLNPEHTSIIELNKEFYCLIDNYNNKILLLNKDNLIVAKKIELNVQNSDILGVLKISDKIITVFFSSYNTYANNYDILSNGIKWKLIKRKELLEKKCKKILRYNNYIIFREDEEVYIYKSRKDQYRSIRHNYFLFEIKKK